VHAPETGGLARPAAAPVRDFDGAALRRALGHFTTGVTVVTAARAGAAPIGITVNSFNAVSLEPPLVLFSVARHCHSLPALRQAPAYAINVLRDDQRELSQHFAGAQGAKWTDVHWQAGVTASPLLDAVLATFECEPFARHDGGDHEIFVGRVVALTHDECAQPLVFFRGDYGTVVAPACAGS